VVAPDAGAGFAADAARLVRGQEPEVVMGSTDLTEISASQWPTLRLIAQWDGGSLRIETEPGGAARRYLRLRPS